MALAAALGWLIPGAARAHPHAWIDIAVEVLFDSAGRVAALRQTWAFDEFYTADTVGKGDPRKIDAVVNKIIGNLRGWGYFTKVRGPDGKPVAVLVDGATGAMEAKRLTMRFVTALTQPLAAPLSYAVFDPTYFIEMLHQDRADAVRLVDAPAGCHVQLHHPKPDGKMVAMAQALDRSQSGGDGLGMQFAETVDIRCDAMP